MSEDFGSLRGYKCKLQPMKGKTIVVDGEIINDDQIVNCEIDLNGKVTIISIERDEQKYCCERFRQIIEEPESAYSRQTTFAFTQWPKETEPRWHTDFSDGEYGDIEINFCPFCGAKPRNPK